jgi:hypothetical protein
VSSSFLEIAPGWAIRADGETKVEPRPLRQTREGMRCPADNAFLERDGLLPRIGMPSVVGGVCFAPPTPRGLVVRFRSAGRWTVPVPSRPSTAQRRRFGRGTQWSRPLQTRLWKQNCHWPPCQLERSRGIPTQAPHLVPNRILIPFGLDRQRRSRWGGNISAKMTQDCMFPLSSVETSKPYFVAFV